MFEDLIHEKPRPTPVSKDTRIKAMKEDIKLKEEHINDLLSEIIKRGETIKILERERDYLENL